MPTILSEQIDLSEAQIDSAARVMRNVVLIRAGTSQNRRHYSESVLQKAAPLFEGVKSYDGHEQRARSVAETTGWYANVRYENGALRADRHFSGTQAGKDVQSIAEDIVSGKAPKTVAGLSINAVGEGKVQKLSDGDALVIESITKAKSVDDVGNPAAGGGYTEAKQGDELAVALLEAMTFEEFYQARPDFIGRIQKELKAVRQDDAVKAAIAEKEAAIVEADRLRVLLKEAQEALSKLNELCDAAVSEADTARRALGIEQALNAVSLPASWKENLREQLTETAPDMWAAVIQTERQKAERAGYKPRVTVTGAEARTAPEHPVREQSFEPVLKENEDLGEWIKRVASTSLP